MAKRQDGTLIVRFFSVFSRLLPLHDLKRYHNSILPINIARNVSQSNIGIEKSQTALAMLFAIL
ncbi:MAG: hypothetical protein ACTTKO_07020 [Candidatus Limimorpha sp.]